MKNPNDIIICNGESRTTIKRNRVLDVYLDSKSSVSPPLSNSRQVMKWQKPDNGELKLNTDGAYFEALRRWVGLCYQR
jgi:hypothetical protein